MVQLFWPPTTVTVVPETVQIDGVVDAKLTVNPELAVALTVNGADKGCAASRSTLREAEIDRLIELGHLRQDGREDRNEVLLALYGFLDQSALGDAHR